MVETKPPPPRQFVAFNWLSLVGCTWTEPTSVWPVDSILVDGSIIVKFLFLMKLTTTWFWKLLVGCWSTGFGLSACTRGYAYSTATRSEEKIAGTARTT